LEANVAYYCLHQLKILPSTFMKLEENEKAFIIASIEVKIKNDKKNSK